MPHLPCRVLVDAPSDGAWNMGADEVLLDAVAEGGPPTLRFYQWAEPTLSLGYFQSHADRQHHTPSRGLSVVRRSSGGGALVHDHELTYSLALPAAHPSARDAVALTCLVHRALREAILELGAGGDRLTLCEAGPAERSVQEPFLCFQRRAPGDLLWKEPGGESHKICGSAQRKRRGAVLQHGGILLAQSVGAPELQGLEDLCQTPISADQLRPFWMRNLLSHMELDPYSSIFNPVEQARTTQVVGEQFSRQSWLERR